MSDDICECSRFSFSNVTFSFGFKSTAAIHFRFQRFTIRRINILSFFHQYSFQLFSVSGFQLLRFWEITEFVEQSNFPKRARPFSSGENNRAPLPADKLLVRSH